MDAVDGLFACMMYFGWNRQTSFIIPKWIWNKSKKMRVQLHWVCVQQTSPRCRPGKSIAAGSIAAVIWTFLFYGAAADYSESQGKNAIVSEGKLFWSYSLCIRAFFCSKIPFLVMFTFKLFLSAFFNDFEVPFQIYFQDAYLVNNTWIKYFIV